MRISQETNNGGASHTGDSDLTLKPYSERVQRVAPSASTRTATLPPATRMVRMKGVPRFYILNTGSNSLEIDDNDGTLLETLSADEGAMVGLLDNSTNAGRWIIHKRALESPHTLNSSTRSNDISEIQVDRGALEQETCQVAMYKLAHCFGFGDIYTRDDLAEYVGEIVQLDDDECYVVERFDDLTTESIQSVTIEQQIESCATCDADCTDGCTDTLTDPFVETLPDELNLDIDSINLCDGSSITEWDGTLVKDRQGNRVYRIEEGGGAVGLEIGTHTGVYWLHPEARTEEGRCWMLRLYDVSGALIWEGLSGGTCPGGAIFYTTGEGCDETDEVCEGDTCEPCDEARCDECSGDWNPSAYRLTWVSSPTFCTECQEASDSNSDFTHVRFLPSSSVVLDSPWEVHEHGGPSIDPCCYATPDDEGVGSVSVDFEAYDDDVLGCSGSLKWTCHHDGYHSVIVKPYTDDNDELRLGISLSTLRYITGPGQPQECQDGEDERDVFVEPYIFAASIPYPTGNCAGSIIVNNQMPSCGGSFFAWDDTTFCGAVWTDDLHDSRHLAAVGGAILLEPLCKESLNA